MAGSQLDRLLSRDIRREIELRLELWENLLGNGPPEALRARARAAGYVPQPYGFDLNFKDSPQFVAETGKRHFEFSVGVSMALRALRGVLFASGDLLKGWNVVFCSLPETC